MRHDHVVISTVGKANKERVSSSRVGKEAAAQALLSELMLTYGRGNCETIPVGIDCPVRGGEPPASRILTANGECILRTGDPVLEH
jgi:hypothetical protein